MAERDAALDAQGQGRPVRWPGRSTALLWIAPLLFLTLFYFYPLATILQTSFARSEAGIGGALLRAFADPGTRGVLWFTVWQAAVSTVLTLVIGLPGAFLLARYSFPGKRLLRALTGIPFVLPTLVVAAAFNALLGPSGWLNVLLMGLLGLSAPPIAFSQSLAAIILAHIFYNTTIVLRLVGDFWSRLDPRHGAAAQVLGASAAHRFRTVTLPLLAPAVTAAALLVFIFDFTSFGVILILGGPRFATLEVEIYIQTVSLFNLPLAAALSVIQLAATLALTVMYTRLMSRLSRPLSLQAPQVAQQPLRGRRNKLLAAALIILLLALLVAPLAALASRSFVRLSPRDAPRQIAPTGLTLDFYRQLGRDPQEGVFFVPPTVAIRNSLGFAGATVLLGLALGLPASWALARDSRSPTSRLLDPILMLPLGTSAVTLGLGFILALDQPPLNLRASPLLLPLAHTLVAFPFIVRSLTPALRAIQPRLREAALVLGASPTRVLRTIDLPLIGRALLVAASFAFMISLGEFGATSLLARPEFPTVPVAIFRFLSRPGAVNFGQAMALSTILMVLTGGGMLAIERFRLAEIGEF